MTVSCVVKAFGFGASQSLGSHLALRASQVQDQFRESMFETLPRRAVVVRLLRVQTVCLPQPLALITLQVGGYCSLCLSGANKGWMGLT